MQEFSLNFPHLIGSKICKKNNITKHTSTSRIKFNNFHCFTILKFEVIYSIYLRLEEI